jgi:hypothetical protein
MSDETVMHTPGPWHCPLFHGRPQDIEQQRKLGLSPVPALMNDGARIIMTDAGEDTKRVALVDCQTMYKRGTGHQTECAERDANARLIAAAPDLLAALRKIVDARDLDVNAAWFREIANEALTKLGERRPVL